MKCPNCGHPKSHVTRSTSDGQVITRTRECDECIFKWSTTEASSAEFRRLRDLQTAVRQLPGIAKEV